MRQLENEQIKYWLDENEILHSEFKSNLDMTPEIAKTLIDMRHEISNGQNQYWVFSLHNVKSYNKEAREYVDKNGQQFLHASAAIINSHLTKFLFNIYLKLNPPKIPIQMFTNREDASAWLREIKRLNENN